MQSLPFELQVSLYRDVVLMYIRDYHKAVENERLRLVAKNMFFHWTAITVWYKEMTQQERNLRDFLNSLFFDFADE